MPTTPEITILSFIIMSLTILVNISVSWYENRKGQKIGSNILISDSLHTRSDIFASIAVILGFFAIKSGYTFMDPVIAILIAGMGIRIIKESSNVLIDKAPIDDRIIKKIVNSTSGVKDSHMIRTRGSSSHIYVDLHIIPDSCYSLNEAHK